MAKYTVWFLRVTVLLVTLLCIELIAGAGEPKPVYIQIPNGIICGVIWSLPLWVSTKEIRSSLKRYLLALLLLPMGVITSIAMLGYNLFVTSFVAVIYLLLISRLLIRGKSERSII